MVRISRRAALAAALAAPLPLRAEEPWKDKSPSEWTDADLVRILNNSPWAQPVDIVFGSPDISTPGPQHALEGFIDIGPKRPGIPFVVRWLSALPYKEAYARAVTAEAKRL